MSSVCSPRVCMGLLRVLRGGGGCFEKQCLNSENGNVYMFDRLGFVLFCFFFRKLDFLIDCLTYSMTNLISIKAF